MKSQKIALFLLVSAAFATASVSAFWRDLASSAVDKVSSAASSAYDLAKGAYGKYSDFKETELGQKFHSYAKEHGTSAAEKAFDISMSYFDK